MKKNVMTVMNSIEAEITRAYKEYETECEDIAQACIEEGYPSNGSNYDLRCSSLWEDYYLPEVEYLEGRLEEERKHHLFVSLWDMVGWCGQLALINSRTTDWVDPDGNIWIRNNTATVEGDFAPIEE